ncbi:MAG: hypothetical protein WC586_06135 [Methanoregula sp.]
MKITARRKKERSVLDKVKKVKIEIIEPETISPVRPLAISLPGFSMDTTDIGVADINKNKALYLRLTLRSDN